MQYLLCFKLFADWYMYKVFVHWKLKLLNFLMDSVLNSCSMAENCRSWHTKTATNYEK